MNKLTKIMLGALMLLSIGFMVDAKAQSAPYTISFIPEWVYVDEFAPNHWTVIPAHYEVTDSTNLVVAKYDENQQLIGGNQNYSLADYQDANIDYYIQYWGATENEAIQMEMGLLPPPWMWPDWENRFIDNP